MFKKNDKQHSVDGADFKSAIYEGFVRHRRKTPRKHEFTYKVFMMYLDLDELARVINLSSFWSCKRCSLARFKREDFHGDPNIPLKQAVTKTIERYTGREFDGSVRMLANWRYYGFNMNPLTTYFCFDRNDQLIYILAEVTNTPWNERRAYFIDCAERTTQSINTVDAEFDKDFSVSPFHPLDMKYFWKSTVPDNTLSIHIENELKGQRVFDATLVLERVAISSKALNRILIRYPVMTVKVFIAIYWQALKLFVKGVPFLGKDRLSSGVKLR